MVVFHVFLSFAFLLRFRLFSFFFVVSLFSLFGSNFYSYSLSSFLPSFSSFLTSLPCSFLINSSVLLPYCPSLPFLVMFSSFLSHFICILPLCRLFHSPLLLSLLYFDATTVPVSLLSYCLFLSPSCFLVSLFLLSSLLSLSFFFLVVVRLSYICFFLSFPFGPFLLRFRLSSFFLVLSLFSLFVSSSSLTSIRLPFVSNFYSSSLRLFLLHFHSFHPLSSPCLTSFFLVVFYLFIPLFLFPCRSSSSFLAISSIVITCCLFLTLSFSSLFLFVSSFHLVSDRPTNRPQRARHSSNNRPRSQI